MQTIPSASRPQGLCGSLWGHARRGREFRRRRRAGGTGALYGEFKSFTAVLVGQGVMLCLSGLGYLVLIHRIEQEEHLGSGAVLAGAR